MRLADAAERGTRSGGCAILLSGHREVSRLWHMPASVDLHGVASWEGTQAKKPQDRTATKLIIGRSAKSVTIRPRR
jgi:hypothetical protein